MRFLGFKDTKIKTTKETIFFLNYYEDLEFVQKGFIYLNEEDIDIQIDDLDLKQLIDFLLAFKESNDSIIVVNSKSLIKNSENDLVSNENLFKFIDKGEDYFNYELSSIEIGLKTYAGNRPYVKSLTVLKELYLDIISKLNNETKITKEEISMEKNKNALLSYDDVMRKYDTLEHVIGLEESKLLGGSKILGNIALFTFEGTADILGYGFKYASNFIKETLEKNFTLDKIDFTEVKEIKELEKKVKTIMSEVKYSNVMNMSNPCLVGLNTNLLLATNEFENMFKIINKEGTDFIDDAIQIVSKATTDENFQKSFRTFKKTDSRIDGIRHSIYSSLEKIIDRNKLHDSMGVNKLILNMGMLENTYTEVTKINKDLDINILHLVMTKLEHLYRLIDSLVEYATENTISITKSSLNELGYCIDNTARLISIYSEVFYGYRTHLNSIITLVNKIENR